MAIPPQWALRSPWAPAPASPVAFDPISPMIPGSGRDGRGSKRDQAGTVSGGGGGRPDGLLVVVDRLPAVVATVLFISRSLARTAILVALWANMPSRTTWGAIDPIKHGALPTPRVLEIGDPALGAGAPLDQFRKRREDSTPCRCAPGRPFLGMATYLTPRDSSSASTFASP